MSMPKGMMTIEKKTPTQYDLLGSAVLIKVVPTKNATIDTSMTHCGLPLLNPNPVSTLATHPAIGAGANHALASKGERRCRRSM